MPPITFNPGPSQLSPAVVNDLASIARSGLLSTSHRTDRVRDVVRAAVEGVHRAMDVPEDYAVVFQPSATAAMDLLLSNLTRAASHHFVLGAFSDRFRRTAVALGRDVSVHETQWGTPVEWRSAEIDAATELVAVTHNETSTGLCWPPDELAALRRHLGADGPLLAIDVTSSFGALRMDWTVADVWFGSVQKCLGLPAGLGVVLLGPRAVERCREVAAAVPAWRSLPTLLDRIATHQTVETPNVLAIALLARQLARWDLTEIETELLARSQWLQDAALGQGYFVEDSTWRSPTVHAIRVDDPQDWRRRAAAGGMTIGGGYGPLKSSTIRIANFPAHSQADLERLVQALRPA